MGGGGTRTKLSHDCGRVALLTNIPGGARFAMNLGKRPLAAVWRGRASTSPSCCRQFDGGRQGSAILKASPRICSTRCGMWHSLQVQVCKTKALNSAMLTTPRPIKCHTHQSTQHGRTRADIIQLLFTPAACQMRTFCWACSFAVLSSSA